MFPGSCVGPETWGDGYEHGEPCLLAREALVFLDSVVEELVKEFEVLLSLGKLRIF